MHLMVAISKMIDMDIMGIFTVLPTEKLHYLLDLEYHPRESRSVAQSGSAAGLGPAGRRFESCRSDHRLPIDWQIGDPF